MSLDSLSAYRKEAISIAFDFHYPYEIVNRIKNAKTENQIANALRDGRLGGK